MWENWDEVTAGHTEDNFHYFERLKKKIVMWPKSVSIRSIAVIPHKHKYPKKLKLFVNSFLNRNLTLMSYVLATVQFSNFSCAKSFNFLKFHFGFMIEVIDAITMNTIIDEKMNTIMDENNHGWIPSLMNKQFHG